MWKKYFSFSTPYEAIPYDTIEETRILKSIRGMSIVEGLEERLEMARREPAQLDRLLDDYLPFLRGQAARAAPGQLEYDDRLSLAMLTFVGCVRQYTPGRGGFLSFCSVCIRNRLADEERKLRRSPKVVPLFGEDALSQEREAALAHYDREQERQTLAEEIASYQACLEPYGITFGDLARLCPKRQGARQLCVSAARALVGEAEMAATLVEKKRVAQTELALRLGVSPKTIEKHRKYIAAVALLLLGDYPGIQAFLPIAGEVDT